jgi:pantoate--beta-alanine ligase
LELVVLPTVREEGGLAMSSRNAYLRPDERVAARVLYRALGQARELQESGVNDLGAIRKRMADVVAAEPLAALEYATVVDPMTFEELDTLRSPALGVIAVRVGATRLIDNMPLGQ